MRLEIDKAIYGGNGLGRLPAEEGARAGKAVFVPFTLPGETIEATLEEDRGGYATARADSIVHASVGRTEPGCRYFGVCGGCQYQHADYALQLEMKRAVLRETLNRAGIREVPEVVTVHAEQYGYRNRIRLHVDLRDGFRIGYHGRGSRQLLDIVECPIAAPALEEALLALRRAGESGAIPAGTVQIELFCNSQDEVLVSLFCDRDPGVAAVSSLGIFLVAGEARIKGICSFVAGEHKVASAAATWGATTLEYQVADQTLQVSAASFFQTNCFLVEPLRELVSRGRSGALAWDLYAGVGLFAAALSRTFAHVIAVEAAPASSADLLRNLRGANARAVRSPMLEFLRREVKSAAIKPPQLIVVDPPRAGLGKEITALLSQVGARTIVYISCDPATLSRDLRPLLDCGYTASQMYLIDLFPQTFHLETVTVLDRAG